MSQKIFIKNLEKKLMVRVGILGAGLGGGSSDAAAVLYWAGMTDRDRAVSLGADVAFCLLGGRARVTPAGMMQAFATADS